MGTIIEETLFLPKRWGLSKEAIGGLGDSLENVWTRYRGCFKTKTRDSAKHAWTYLRGLLEMKTGRNYANIARRVSDPMEDGQNLQQFMSDSPWEAQAVIRNVQEEIASTPSLQAGGILLLDVSADEKAGPMSAGAGRQHNGRLRKIEMSPGQVGRFPTRFKVLNGEQPVEVRQLITSPQTHFQRYPVRHTERGPQNDRFTMRRIWTIREGVLAEDWLVIRHEDDQHYTYALSNAPADTPPERLVWLKCVRHFVERTNQDSKSELGWDELQAQKFRAWEHHLALPILATWFIVQTKEE